ncbi:MAG: SUF system NifU family Fe-S cluster assembly protein [Erysipelotrichaceae bacterium]|nr:SUF system NifU family Fe-S cluster assembly protein [Erysipelotrichaceae bacterium]
MLSLDNPLVLRSIIMDHYENPRHHGLVDDESYRSTNMNSESCIDNIDVQLKMTDGVIKDLRFDGEACAISTASTSIMGDLVIGKTKEEALHIRDNYMNMIYEKDYDVDLLEEAIAFKNTHKQANRIKCATIGWNALDKLLESED